MEKEMMKDADVTGPDGSMMPGSAETDGEPVNAEPAETDEPESHGADLRSFCTNCGAGLSDTMKFCSRCGQKIGYVDNMEIADRISQYNAQIAKKARKKSYIPVLIAFGLMGLLVLTVILIALITN